MLFSLGRQFYRSTRYKTRCPSIFKRAMNFIVLDQLEIQTSLRKGVEIEIPFVFWLNNHEILSFEICFHIKDHLLYHARHVCYIFNLDCAVNQRCTCVNKQKKKRKQVGVMKEYRQMPAAVESVVTGRPVWEPACRLRTPRWGQQPSATPSWVPPAKMWEKC